MEKYSIPLNPLKPELSVDELACILTLLRGKRELIEASHSTLSREILRQELASASPDAESQEQVSQEQVVVAIQDELAQLRQLARPIGQSISLLLKNSQDLPQLLENCDRLKASLNCPLEIQHSPNPMPQEEEDWKIRVSLFVKGDERISPEALAGLAEGLSHLYLDANQIVWKEVAGKS